MTSLLDGARKLVTRGTDIGARIDGLDAATEAARGRLDDRTLATVQRLHPIARELGLSLAQLVEALARAGSTLPQAMTAEAATYESENVIGDPNQTFGIEIEFDGANPNAVARALHEAGLASSARQDR